MTDVYGYDQPSDPSFRSGGSVQQPPAQTHVVTMGTIEPDLPFGWCYVVTSVFGFFCCQPFGTIALVMSLLSYSDHKGKDYGNSRSKGNTALGFGVAAIVLGAILWIGLIIGLVVVGAAAANVVNNNLNVQSNNYGG